MSLSNLSQFTNSKRFGDEMAVDPNMRQSVAAFFGDPSARDFVRESGGISGAVANIDADNGAVEPLTPPAHENPFAPKNAPVIAPAVGNMGTSPGNPPVAPTGSPAMPKFTGTMDREMFLQNNPQAGSFMKPQRPVSVLDNMGTARKALLLAFGGLEKFGANLDHRPSNFDQFWGQQMDIRQQQAQYDKNEPMLTRQAQDASYNNYLDQQMRGAQVRHMNAQTDQTAIDRERQRQEQIRTRKAQLAQTWQGDPRYVDDPESFAKAAIGLGHDPQEIADVMNSIPQQRGLRYDVEYSKDGGVPIGVRDKSTGTFFPKEKIPAEANDIWGAAQAGHQTAFDEGMKKARESQMFKSDALANSKFIVITDPKTGMARVVRGPVAEQLTSPGGGYAGGPVSEVNKARTGWAQFGDVTRATNNVFASLPKKPLSSKEIASLSMAMKEYHGPIEDVIKSKFVAGMNPEATRLTAALLQLRDNIIVVPAIMKIPPSDPRVQSLWNAMPAPADFSNPQLAIDKLRGVYQMIESLSMGIAGDPNTFGVHSAEIPDQFRVEAPQGNTPAQVDTRRNKRTGEVQQLINGQWTTVQKPDRPKPKGPSPQYKSRRVDLGAGTL